MARRARLLLSLAALLAALPAAAARPERAIVSSRDGDLYLGKRAITTDGTDTDPD